jgi:diguanylate cyclase (GGDEF)-like protein/PAS domain S-box-containing protein
MHPLLERQLKKATSPDGLIQTEFLCDLVNRTYEENDRSRRINEHSVTLMSQEMMDLNSSLRDQATEISAIVDSIADGIIVLNECLTISSLNRSAEVLLKTASDALVNKSYKDIFSDFDLENFCEQIHLKPPRTEQFCFKSLEISVKRLDGSIFPAELYMRQIQYSDKFAFVCILRDITQQKESQQKLFEAAFFDKLTQLPNRALFIDRLNEAIKKCTRYDGTYTAILFIDIDNFKLVNDSLGHEAGDILLAQVARIFQNALRHYDTVARLGGDEFTILLTDMPEPEYAEHVAQRILTDLKTPLKISGRELYINASIGIYLLTQNDKTPELILRNADLAMYHAKTGGKGRFEIFHQRQHDQMLSRLHLETALRQALQNQEIQVYYQPIVCFKTGQIVGFESLMRWQSSHYGFLLPGQFIPIAEETGMIKDLGLFVLDQSCKQLAVWQKALSTQKLFVSVNVSSRQLNDKDSLKALVRTIKDYDLPKGSLNIELTESSVLQTGDNIEDTLSLLKKAGADLWIDDFGTGYSALEYLQRFPFDMLKIDRAFIASISKQEKNFRLVSGIVSLAHSIGLQVVAEGLETDDEVSKLNELSVDYVQGYYFAKPLPAVNVLSLLLSQTRYNTKPLKQTETLFESA